jgi:hypothetical protein
VVNPLWSACLRDASSWSHPCSSLPWSRGIRPRYSIALHHFRISLPQFNGATFTTKVFSIESIPRQFGKCPCRFWRLIKLAEYSPLPTHHLHSLVCALSYIAFYANLIFILCSGLYFTT